MKKILLGVLALSCVALGASKSSSSETEVDVIIRAVVDAGEQNHLIISGTAEGNAHLGTVTLDHGAVDNAGKTTSETVYLKRVGGGNLFVNNTHDLATVTLNGKGKMTAGNSVGTQELDHTLNMTIGDQPTDGVTGSATASDQVREISLTSGTTNVPIILNSVIAAGAVQEGHSGEYNETATLNVKLSKATQGSTR